MAIDRDSYAAGRRGYDDFMADARAVLEAVRRYAALDACLETPAAAADTQRIIDIARRGLAAAAVDEIATLADLMADTAHELGAEIEEDLRAAKRLIDMTLAESNSARLPKLKPIETMPTLFDAAQLPELSLRRYRQ